MDIYTAESDGRGRGVFAARPYRQGELIEICDVIVIPEAQVTLIDKTLLFNYYFSWSDGAAAIALGHGSLYNHSSDPNAAYRKDFVNGKIHFTASKDILVGEEIFTDYNSHYPGRKLWFEEAGRG